MSGYDDAIEIINRAYYDAADRTFTFVRTQDVEPIIDVNKELQNTPQHTETFHHIGTIPNVVLEQWLNEEWARGNLDMQLDSPEFDALVARKLRDRDWLWLRTTDKKF